MLSAEFVDTLTIVGRILASARDDWCVIGGTAAALHGAGTPPPTDIDILMSVDDAGRILAPYGISVAAGTGTEKFRSALFCSWTAEAVPVDFMAGFDVRANGAWVPVPPKPAESVQVGDTSVWVPSVDDLLAMYVLFDRPKDAKRIAALAALFG